MFTLRNFLFSFLYLSSLLLYGYLPQDQNTLLYYAIQYKDAQGNVLPNLAINSSNVSLIITATNRNPQTPVTVSSISITIPEGTAGTDLTPTILTSDNVVAPSKWNYYWSGNVCIFTPNTPTDGQISDSVVFIFNQININGKVGSVHIIIQEQSTKSLSATLYADKFPENFQFSDLSANPSSVGFGGSTTISWTSSSDATYTIQYGNLPSPFPVTGSGSYIYQAVNLQQNPTTFTVTASMANPDDPSHPLTAQKQVTVTVLNGGSYLNTNINSTFMGSPVKLSWQVSDADPNTTGTISNNLDDTTISISSDQLETGSKTVNTPELGLSVVYTLEYTKGGTKRHIDSKNIFLTPTITIQVGTQPYGIAITPDGKFAYVVSLENISVIDTSSNTVVGQPIPVNRRSIEIAITPDGKFVYVVSLENISVIDTSTNKVVGQPIPVGGTDIAITPNGKFAYVVNSVNGSISVIEISSNKVSSLAIPKCVNAGPIVITPDGKFAYVADGNIFVIDTSSNTVVGQPISLSKIADTIAITPDGKFIYAGSGGIIFVIDTSLNTVVGQLMPGDANPGGIAIAPNGKFAYAANIADKSVYVIDISSNKFVGQPIPVGNVAEAIAITPDGKYAYVTNADDNSVSVIALPFYTPRAQKPK